MNECRSDTTNEAHETILDHRIGLLTVREANEDANAKAFDICSRACPVHLASCHPTERRQTRTFQPVRKTT